MIKVLAIDDEPLALQQLVAYIKKIPFFELVAQCQSALEAREVMDREPVDALFCDINMPDLSGMEFVRQLPVRPIIVFTTAYSEYASPREEAGGEDSIFVKTDYKTVRISLSDIRYVEGMSEYLKLYLDSQPKPVITLLSMKKMEEFLPQNFMRIHRSYIVNLDKVQEVNKNRVILGPAVSQPAGTDDVYLPIGDNYKEQFNDYLSTRFLGK